MYALLVKPTPTAGIPLCRFFRRQVASLSRAAISSACQFGFSWDPLLRTRAVVGRNSQAVDSCSLARP